MVGVTVGVTVGVGVGVGQAALANTYAFPPLLPIERTVVLPVPTTLLAYITDGEPVNACWSSVKVYGVPVEVLYKNSPTSNGWSASYIVLLV
jgi:hypothetical protein